MSNKQNDNQIDENNELPQQEDSAAAQIQKEYESMKSELETVKDKYLRVLAELDNMRKQQERRISDRVKYEKKIILMRMIEILDDLDRALKYESVSDKETLAQSLKHMHSQMLDVLQRSGVTSFSSHGQAFDPKLHEAIEMIEDSNEPEGQIVQETQKGYVMGDELLRPARVHVSSGKTSADETE